MNSGRCLVVRVGAMGDVLHALPAVAALRQRWPETGIDWVVDPRWAPLLVDETGRGPVVSRVHVAETRAWSRRPFSGATLRSVLGLREALRASRYDHVVDVQGTLRSAVIACMAGSANLAGFADPREFGARLLYRRLLNRRGEHVVEQNAALLGEALGVQLAPAPVVLPRRRASEEWANHTFGSSDRIALLAPTAGWGAKQWPAVRFGALAQALRQMGFAVLVNATYASDPVGEEVVRTGAGAAQIVVSDVAQLIALTRRAAVVVGGDSGPVHLAAALGRPVVGLYGLTDPARNGPWGPGPVRVLRDPASITNHSRVPEVEAGLSRIPVDSVVDAVRAVVA